jgi:hypothetical protein
MAGEKEWFKGSEGREVYISAKEHAVITKVLAFPDNDSQRRYGRLIQTAESKDGCHIFTEIFGRAYPNAAQLSGAYLWKGIACSNQSDIDRAEEYYAVEFPSYLKK